MSVVSLHQGGDNRAPADLRRRQAAEQYFTSGQTFAQRLRQVNGRPQIGQILLGRCGLRCAIGVSTWIAR